MLVSFPEKPLPSGGVAESLCRSSKHPRPTFGSDIEADDSPCTGELERSLIIHSEEELSGHTQVQVD